MKKKMTIDTLARMTQDQFSRVDERFDKVDQRFDKVDDTLNKMNSTLKTVLDVVLEIPSKKAFERLENKVNVMDVELASVQRKISK
jgi:archaellum component FlaC